MQISTTEHPLFFWENSRKTEVQFSICHDLTTGQSTFNFKIQSSCTNSHVSSDYTRCCNVI